jgi:hypothetical protein
VTTAVCAEVTACGPVASVAVTLTRRVLPASAVTRVYVLCVADVMSVHAAPDASHRDQRYAKVIPLPVHVPGFAVNASPTTVEPEIVGGTVFGGPTGAVTAAVAFETAGAPTPSAFDAVTLTRSRKPTSPAATT